MHKNASMYIQYHFICIEYSSHLPTKVIPSQTRQVAVPRQENTITGAEHLASPSYLSQWNIYERRLKAQRKSISVIPRRSRKGPEKYVKMSNFQESIFSAARLPRFELTPLVDFYLKLFPSGI